MKSFCTTLIICTVLMLTTTTLSTQAGSMPGPDAASLWVHITEDAPYTEWGYWPDHQGMQAGKAPHGVKNKVFVNKYGLDSEKTPVAYGTVIVKENYNAEEKLMAITVMYKVKGYNPDSGDWFWVKYGPEGTADIAGKPAGCIGCHSTRMTNDFMLIHEFK